METVDHEFAEEVFSRCVSINPHRPIKKGSIVKFVSMDQVEPKRKKIQLFSRREYLGGARFQNRDTIFARITPSLENGKTAYVDFLKEGETAAGSTEFLVFSSTAGKTIPEYVYYLSISATVREQAIKSMTGTSGRQRVDTNVFDQITVPLPSLSEQKGISKILSDLDSKIELNQQLNKTLESIAQAIFKHWFIDFEFPDENGQPYKSSGGEMVDSDVGPIPSNFVLKTFDDEIELLYGKSLPEKKRMKGPYPVYGSNGIVGFHDEFIEEAPGIIIGRKGTVGKIEFSNDNFWAIDTTYFTHLKDKQDTYFWYYLLKASNLDSMNTHSAVPGLNRKDVLQLQYAKPSSNVLSQFNSIISSLKQKERVSLEENSAITGIRDLLLPKLMSGKIRVPAEGSNV